MKASIVALAAFAGLSAAQVGSLPTCAQSCAAAQFGGDGYAGCGTDPKCICANKDFISSIACCLAGVCNEADQASAVSFAQQLCSANGVSVPSAVSCTSTPSGSATGAASSATTTPSGSSSGAATTTGAANTASSTSGSSSSASSAASSAAAAGTSSSRNAGPRPTAMVGAGALGGIIAGLALL